MNNSPRYPQRVRNDLRFRELTVLLCYALSVLAPVFSALSLAARRWTVLHRAALTITANSSFLNLMLTLCRQQ